MQLVTYIRGRQWITVLGYGIYVATLTAGYYYNLTFVQLGLVDLGVRRIGMPAERVAVVMGILAILTLLVAVAVGMTMDRRGWSTRLLVKIRLLFLVVALQLGLTVVAPLIDTPAQFLAWVVVCAIPLGVGIPVAFSFMLDFIPIRDRGYVAAVVAGLSFFAAALYPFEWNIVEFSAVMSLLMLPAAIVLGVLSVKRFDFMAVLAAQHRRFGVGRFCLDAPVHTMSYTFWGLVVLMFGVFFIDSLGFLRIIEEPAYIYTSWQSPELDTRLFIAVLHVVGALMAGVLYTAFERRFLFLWVFGLFAFTHLLYVFDLRFATPGSPPLLLPAFYVLAVSFYTTLNFALWPDLSTPATIGAHTAIGVGIAGFLATFSSTALALYSDGIGLALVDHLAYVNALALVLLVALPVALYLRRMQRYAQGGQPA